MIHGSCHTQYPDSVQNRSSCLTGSHLTSECVSSDSLWSNFASQLIFDLICGETATAAKNPHLFFTVRRRISACFRCNRVYLQLSTFSKSSKKHFNAKWQENQRLCSSHNLSLTLRLQTKQPETSWTMKAWKNSEFFNHNRLHKQYNQQAKPNSITVLLLHFLL